MLTDRTLLSRAEKTDSTIVKTIAEPYLDASNNFYRTAKKIILGNSRNGLIIARLCFNQMLPKRKRKTPLKFAREVEFNFGEVGLCHLQDVTGVGEEDVAAVAVYSHKLVFAGFEGF
mgnify:CR=1 FL=1